MSEEIDGYMRNADACEMREARILLELQNARLRGFAMLFLTPECEGFSVGPWVRDAAREALGMKRVETNQKPNAKLSGSPKEDNG